MGVHYSFSYSYAISLESISDFQTYHQDSRRGHTYQCTSKHLCLHQFLMGLLNDMESMLNQLHNFTPLRTINQVFHELVCKEIHLKSQRSSQPHTIIATSVIATPHVPTPPRGLGKKNSNQRILTSSLTFVRVRGHTIDKCFTCAHTFLNFAALANPKPIPPSYRITCTTLINHLYKSCPLYNFTQFNIFKFPI